VHQFLCAVENQEAASVVTVERRLAASSPWNGTTATAGRHRGGYSRHHRFNGRGHADMAALSARLVALKRARTTARQSDDLRRNRVTGKTVMAEWSAAKGVEDRRQPLLSRLEAVHVSAGGAHGRAFDPNRVSLQWRDVGADRANTCRSNPTASAMEICSQVRHGACLGSTVVRRPPSYGRAA